MSVDEELKELTVLEAVIYHETVIKPKHLHASYTILTKEGEITMFDPVLTKEGETTTSDSALDEFVLYRIFLHEDYQRKGILTKLIGYYQQNSNYNRIVICAGEGPTEYCLSKINYLGRPFVNHGGDLIWTRYSPYCKCHNDDDLLKARSS